MLGYISSTRKKSCQQCVKAKRRCDLGYPFCKRCFTKGMDCAYPNAAVRKTEVIIRQTTPDLALPTTTTTTAEINFSTAPVDVQPEPAKLWNDGFAVCQRMGAGIGAAEAGGGGGREEIGGRFNMVNDIEFDPRLLQTTTPDPRETSHDSLEIGVWSIHALGHSSTIVDEGPGVEHSLDSSGCPDDTSLVWPILENINGTDRSMHPLHGYPSPAPLILPPQSLMPSYLNDAQVTFIIRGLRSFIPTLAYNSHNAFIHAQLYADDHHQPSAYQDACALSALYTLKTKTNTPLLAKTIDAKITALITNSHSWTLEEHLAAVQALIIYQTIRLFDPTLNLQDAALPHNHLLALWTAHLWKRSFTSPLTLQNCHASWVFYESLRRTVFISVFLRGAWSAATRGGLCDQVPVLARLPMSTDERLWAGGKEEFEARTPCMRKREALVAYGEWSQRWRAGREGEGEADDPEGLSDFQRLLLVPCRGREDVRLFYKDGVRIE